MPVPIPVSPTQPPWRWLCPLCGKDFETEEEADRHFAKCEDRRPWKEVHQAIQEALRLVPSVPPTRDGG
ncbi:MAG: hypothetical protein HYY99_01580 [Candidatus Colwellbacteria bacterium]|nr:hypothetical protein [Candidatus Colwellbacteria bacterium]